MFAKASIKTITAVNRLKITAAVIAIAIVSKRIPVNNQETVERIIVNKFAVGNESVRLKIENRTKDVSH